MSGWLAEERSLRSKDALGDLILFSGMIVWTHYSWMMRTLVWFAILWIAVNGYNTDKEISSVFSLDEYNTFFNVFYTIYIIIGIEYSST